MSRIPHFLDSWLKDGSEVVFLVLISVRGLVNPIAIVWLEGLGQLTSGIEPTTSQLVA
jgi:hypothetical protein